jgi:hypothetical protein
MEMVALNFHTPLVGLSFQELEKTKKEASLLSQNAHLGLTSKMIRSQVPRRNLSRLIILSESRKFDWSNAIMKAIELNASRTIVLAVEKFQQLKPIWKLVILKSSTKIFTLILDSKQHTTELKTRLDMELPIQLN